MFIQSAFCLFAHMRYPWYSHMENENSIKTDTQTETWLNECFPSLEQIGFMGNNDNNI